MSKFKIGDKVYYTPQHSRGNPAMVENGIVKSFAENGNPFVVYNCAGEWDDFENYTGACTPIYMLKPGWIPNARNHTLSTGLKGVGVNDFEGPAYNPALDKVRLTGQMLAIFQFMKGGDFKTLGEISNALNLPEASISAILRNFRKEKWGAHIVNKQRRGEGKSGLWEYQLKVRLFKDIGKQQRFDF